MRLVLAGSMPFGSGGSCQDTIAYSYDEQGRLQYRTGVGYGTIGYHYDLAGRPGAHVWPVAPGAYGYNDAGQTELIAQGRAIAAATAR